MADAADEPSSAPPPPTPSPPDRPGGSTAPDADLRRPLDEGRPPSPLDEPLPADPPEPAGEPGAADAPGSAADQPDAADAPGSAADQPEPAGDPGAADAPGGDAEPLRPAVPAGAATVPAGDTAPPGGAAAAAQPAVLRHRRATPVLRLLRGAGVVVRAPGRAARTAAAWTRRPAGRLAVPGVLLTALVGAAVSTGAFLVPAPETAGPTPPAAGASAPSGSPVPTVPPAAPPPIGASPGASPGVLPTGGNPAETLTGWAEDMGGRTDVPMLALRAYGYAELVIRSTTPECGLSWTTLAAIGRVESNHGSSGGATLLPDGRALPPIFGQPLDGQGDRALITDTDGGELDRDVTYDRAVGPMQFIPSTWRTAQVDGSGDGIADVHNIQDAALAAANYLCRGGRNLNTADDWWAAVLSYNNVQSYANAVFGAANDYGLQSRGDQG